MELTDGPVWALWHGGGNYSRGHAEDLERFDTLEDAATEADNRMKCGHYFACHFPFVNKPEARALTPCVDESSTMEIYLADPTGDELIPDYVLEYDEGMDEFQIAEQGDYVTR